MMQNLNILIAFVGGLASFLSPCVLPLVPSYLAQLVGPGVMEAMLAEGQAVPMVAAGGGTLSMSAGSATGAESTASSAASGMPFSLPSRRAPLWHSIAFVCGFSLAFIALGATASVLGGFLKHNQELISRVGGLVMIVLGLHFAGIIKIPLLYREGRLQWRPGQRSYPASFVIGLIFALGWTPCIGVILTSILLLSAQSATLGSGIILLAAYSLGLGVPFLLMGAAFVQMRPLLLRLAPHVGTIERATGIILAVMGFVIFNGWLIYLNRYFAFPINGL